MRRACNRLDEGKRQIESRHFPEAISACQECIELSIKAVFHFAGVKYPAEHRFVEDDFKRVLEKLDVCARELEGKERLYMISEFWFSLYTIAKYGCGKIGVGPEVLFKRKEAFLALEHAYECYNLAMQIYYNCSPIYLDEEGSIRMLPSPSFSL